MAGLSFKSIFKTLLKSGVITDKEEKRTDQHDCEQEEESSHSSEVQPETHHNPREDDYPEPASQPEPPSRVPTSSNIRRRCQNKEMSSRRKLNYPSKESLVMEDSSEDPQMCCDTQFLADDIEVPMEIDDEMGDFTPPGIPPDNNTYKPAKTPEERMERDKAKYPLLPPCNCRKHCTQKIPEERRKDIHTQFWDQEYSPRRAWIFSKVKTQEPSRMDKRGNGGSRRKMSRYYQLPASDGTDVFVCKVFFLHTLGYKSDKIITVTLGMTSPSDITTPKDRRGHHDPAHKLSDESKDLIKSHIMSFHPAVSHYRREHAPLRRYLPPELKMCDMFEDFSQKHPNVCGIESYRKVLKSLNISFAKLGEEECEPCMEYERHKENEGHNGDNIECTTCTDWAKHKERAVVARSWYVADKSRDKVIDEAVCSVDMQKIIMLPRMPGVKSCVFTRRLVQFHMTFAPLGGKKMSRDPIIGVLWTEATSGRSAEDVASTFIKYIRSTSYRDRSKFTFFMDNCGAQNKNWTLYTAMVTEVNREGGPDEVVFRYLEKGHTFMSADSFHAQVEKGMRELKHVYDEDDFISVINTTGTAVPMEVTDFVKYENGMSQGKYTHKPLLAGVQEVKFVKGSAELHWKLSMDDEEYQHGEFLKKKTCEKVMRGNADVPFPHLDNQRGIPEIKKNDILTKLCRFMPPNRHAFWEGLLANNASLDLIDHE